MFSCVVAGRLPLPPPQQIDPTHAVFQLENAELINHLVVFMTGVQAFPEGYGATVHLMWPPEPGKEPHWQLLGSKPSAIFRIRDPKHAGSSAPCSATLGVSIETLPSIELQMQELGQSQPMSGAVVLSKTTEQAHTADAAQLAGPIAQNLFAYLSSFAPDSAPQAVPLLQKWLDAFQRKLQAQGVQFLRRIDNS
ncbi:hypothetical protein MVES1_002828 [Malassezia vespertilionis]|uniref:uncharacterized protein n=1 Tax=Malassezia vespertilionis TaxID=2020962 RepID=UPI0024B090BB|nr:uncharacterized protein MVES1_002828 [Malassezia vespertilionis]WFD07462.1 hypothetical protein MVES1_002828 [Malassezia vespertilionis]